LFLSFLAEISEGGNLVVDLLEEALSVEALFALPLILALLDLGSCPYFDLVVLSS
jgi:hypothetical protein